MAQSKVARRVTRNHARYRGRHEINVVPMIDMMIILVFFLIFTAVFTKTQRPRTEPAGRGLRRA